MVQLVQLMVMRTSPVLVQTNVLSFFDTLVDELSYDEIEAVLAHELGHFKCNHIRKRISVLGTVFLIGLGILGWLINEPWFYNGLGVEQASTYMALILFVIASPAFTFFLQPLFSFISRQHEFEAMILLRVRHRQKT